MPAAHPATQIKRGRKFDQVVEGARTVFLRDGFDRASVDDIAAEAGVSKATLYSYFPDKRMIFIEVARIECKRQADEAQKLVSLSAPPDCVLPVAARRIVEFFDSDFARSMIRICISEAERFPELGEQFYASGAGLLRERLASYLSGAVARGELDIPDVYLAADQFSALCKTYFFPRLCYGLPTNLDEAMSASIVDGAVETFLARYKRAGR